MGAVALPDRELRRIAGICAHLDVDGLRGDIVVARTALAHAAWRGATAVEDVDVRAAVELALPHRRRRSPFDESGLSRDQLDEAMSAGEDAAEDARLAVGEQLAGLEHAHAVVPAGFNEDRTVTMFQVLPEEGPNAVSTEELVRDLRATDARRHTREETPFFSGPRVGVRELVTALP